MVSEANRYVLGPIVAEHGQHRPAQPRKRRWTWAVKRQVCSAVTGPRTMRTIAQRVAVSTAVSWYTLPTPFSLPMEKLSGATRSRGRADPWQPEHLLDHRLGHQASRP